MTLMTSLLRDQSKETKKMVKPVVKTPKGSKPKSTDINPKHYEFFLNGKIHQVADLMEARFHDDMHLSQALKYMMRAGKKPSASYINDVGKCLWWCAKAIMYHNGKSIELPPGAPRA